MSIRNRQQQQSHSMGHSLGATTTGQTRSRQIGEANEVRFLPNPFHAKVDGEPVRVIAFGNVEGMSPAQLCVSGEGLQAWVPLYEVQITDGEALPIKDTQYSGGQYQQGQQSQQGNQ